MREGTNRKRGSVILKFLCISVEINCFRTFSVTVFVAHEIYASSATFEYGIEELLAVVNVEVSRRNESSGHNVGLPDAHSVWIHRSNLRLPLRSA